MPYRRRRNYRRRNRRRNYRKRSHNRSISKKVNLSTGVPDRLYTKLVYTDSYSLADAVGGVGAIQVMRGNSIFDPDQSGTGGQPLGHDQWNNFYFYYKVHASKCEATFISTSSNITSSGLIVGIHPELQTPAVTTTALDILQHPYAKTRIMGTASGNSAVRKFSNFFTTKKMFGVKDLDDNSFKAAFGTNPTNAWYWRIGAYPIDETSINDVRVIVKITYYVELVERILLANS